MKKPRVNLNGIIATIIYKGEKALDFINIEDTDIEDMQEYVHKCLRCEAYCFEITKSVIECPKCGFQWEVLSFE